MKIVKRDGRIVDFDAHLIESAVLKAFQAVDNAIDNYAKEKARNIANYVQKYFEKKEVVPTVEQVQDLVEKGLMSTKRKDVARAFISYRDQRERIRNANSKMHKIFKEKLQGQNIENQNANLDEKSFGGCEGSATSAIKKDIALNDGYMSEMARDNHINNMIYIHDLDSYVLGNHNCLTCPLDDLLAKGFNTRQVDIRPAKSISTAFQLVAVIFQIQSLQQFGGVSASHLDWTMVPYVRRSFLKNYQFLLEHEFSEFRSIEESFRLNAQLSLVKRHLIEGAPTPSIEDRKFYRIGKTFNKIYEGALKKTKEEIWQAAEGLFHNLNSLQSRSGNQLPFSSINFGTCTLPEGRLIIQALLETSIKGVGALHRTSVFPCSIFQCMNGVNRHPGEPNYDLFQLALKSTALRLYPNYANVDWSGNAGYDKNDPRTYFSTMGLVA